MLSRYIMHLSLFRFVTALCNIKDYTHNTYRLIWKNALYAVVWLTKLITGRVAQFCVTPLGNVNTWVILCKSNLITAHPDDTYTARARAECSVRVVGISLAIWNFHTNSLRESRIPPRGPQSGRGAEIIFCLAQSLTKAAHVTRVLITCEPNPRCNIDFAVRILLTRNLFCR